MSNFITQLRWLLHLLGFTLPGLVVGLAFDLPFWFTTPLGGSFYTFLLFGYDKHRAKAHRSRTPEAVLLALTAIGGSPGALLGMFFFRHKTRKTSFRVMFWICAAISVGVVYGLRAIQLGER